VADYSEETRHELRSYLNDAGAAFLEASKQMHVLWEARLNLAMATGDEEAVRSLIGESAACGYLDNCSCGGGGGGSFFR
jgi:hypothetical protein